MLTNPTSFQQNRNLSAVQLATANQDTLKYISSSAAIKGGYFEVREVSAGGQVNQLLVVNNSQELVFMMDGDILAGAKQNRVLNTSILLAPMSKTVIPVSCVEQGRWRFTTDRFSGTDYTAPSFIRAEKARGVTESLRERRGHVSDQGEVWHSVQYMQMASKSYSPTSNLSDVYDHTAGDIDDFIKHFTLDSGANGLAIFVGRDLLSLDIFNRKDIYAEYFKKLLRGVALEAIYMDQGKSPLEEAEAKYRTLDFLDKYDTVEKRDHPGVGIGIEERFESGDMTGFDLRYENQMVHLTALALRERRRSAA
jgi:hypothetical protein